MDRAGFTASINEKSKGNHKHKNRTVYVRITGCCQVCLGDLINRNKPIRAMIPIGMLYSDVLINSIKANKIKRKARFDLSQL